MTLNNYWTEFEDVLYIQTDLSNPLTSSLAPPRGGQFCVLVKGLDNITDCHEIWCRCPWGHSHQPQLYFELSAD